jgi:hypothetical protein
MEAVEKQEVRHLDCYAKDSMACYAEGNEKSLWYLEKK